MCRIALLAGSKSDAPLIEASGMQEILESFGVTADIFFISSDRQPEVLRTFCLEQGQNYFVLIGVAGGVPNLPVVIKSWLPGKIVIGVPLEDKIEYLLASCTTPYDVPVIITGFGKQGLRKAARLVADLKNLAASLPPPAVKRELTWPERAGSAHLSGLNPMNGLSVHDLPK